MINESFLIFRFSKKMESIHRFWRKVNWFLTGQKSREVDRESICQTVTSNRSKTDLKFTWYTDTATPAYIKPDNTDLTFFYSLSSKNGC